MADIETIELGSLNDGPENISKLPSVNFGPGADLLMNDKKQNSSSDNMESDINLGDLENLEKELNSDTFAINKEDNGSSFHEIKSSLFSFSFAEAWLIGNQTPFRSSQPRTQTPPKLTPNFSP